MASRSRSWKSLGIDFVTLRVYAAAIEEKSLAAAAAREHLALSAVSRRIADLECRSGVTLLNRDYRGVTPTSAGEVLFARLGTAFALFESIAAELDALRDGTLGSVRMQAHMSAATMLLPERLSAFCERFPQVQVELEESSSAEIIHNLQMGKIDLGFVSGTTPPSDLSCMTWYEDELVAVMHPSHPMAVDDGVCFSRIMNFPFIGLQKDSALQVLFDAHAKSSGLEPIFRAYNTSFESVRRMVEAGLGVSILPRLAVAPYENNQKIVFRPLLESWAKRPLLLCYRDYDSLSEAAKMVIKHVVLLGNDQLLDSPNLLFRERKSMLDKNSC
ncbi:MULTISPECIES: LysR family transcriptional regulator [unclassified Pseudomonas]|uniref:LysR family transcriptional regulator n=1 Tax=unclassified Pseudomonas TaxID=196821 RepID=UPI0035C19D54